MTLDLKPETAAALKALASARGLSVEDYLQQLLERELPPNSEDANDVEESGMVRENGLLVYRTGRPLRSTIIDDAVRQSRKERARRVLGKRS